MLRPGTKDFPSKRIIDHVNYSLLKPKQSWEATSIQTAGSSSDSLTIFITWSPETT
jgi:hypothetical protein